METRRRDCLSLQPLALRQKCRKLAVAPIHSVAVETPGAGGTVADQAEAVAVDRAEAVAAAVVAVAVAAADLTEARTTMLSILSSQT